MLICCSSRRAIHTYIYPVRILYHSFCKRRLKLSDLYLFASPNQTDVNHAHTYTRARSHVNALAMRECDIRGNKLSRHTSTQIALDVVSIPAPERMAKRVKSKSIQIQRQSPQTIRLLARLSACLIVVPCTLSTRDAPSPMLPFTA